MAGYRSALWLLGISGGGAQGGFSNPLPLPQISGGAAEQGSYRQAWPLLSMGAGVAEPTDEGGGDRRRRKQNERLLLLFAATVIETVV